MPVQTAPPATSQAGRARRVAIADRATAAPPRPNATGSAVPHSRGVSVWARAQIISWVAGTSTIHVQNRPSVHSCRAARASSALPTDESANSAPARGRRHPIPISRGSPKTAALCLARKAAVMSSPAATGAARWRSSDSAIPQPASAIDKASGLTMS